MLNHQAFALAYVGRLREARELSQHAVALALQLDHRDTAAIYESGEAVYEAFAGDPKAARTAQAALKLSSQVDVQYGAALAFALLGQNEKAQQLADDFARRLPQNTSVRFSYLPVLSALTEAQKNNPRAALDILGQVRRLDLSTPQSTTHAPFGAMYTVYARGLALLAAHNGSEAAIEFQKILDHRGIVISDPVGALARLQIARAYRSAGNRTNARVAYENFLKLWQDADSNIPVLRSARAEYASLN